MDLSRIKLGKLAARHDIRTLKLSKYLKTDKLPAPAKSASFAELVPSWPMMLNDTIGDCTCATAGHIVQQVTTYTGAPYVPADADVLKMYEKVSGYRPGDPSTDNGAVSIDVLNYWRKKGLAGHKILAYVALKTGDLTELKQAISIFGNAYIGIQLPNTAASQDVCWTVDMNGGPNSLPGSWGGHAIPAVMYNPAQPNSGGEPQDSTIGIVSWGQIMYMTSSFYKLYADEAYAILDQDFIEKSGLTPSGFDLDQLKADLQAFND